MLAILPFSSHHSGGGRVGALESGGFGEVSNMRVAAAELINGALGYPSRYLPRWPNSN